MAKRKKTNIVSMLLSFKGPIKKDSICITKVKYEVVTTYINEESTEKFADNVEIWAKVGGLHSVWMTIVAQEIWGFVSHRDAK